MLNIGSGHKKTRGGIGLASKRFGFVSSVGMRRPGDHGSLGSFITNPGVTNINKGGSSSCGISGTSAGEASQSRAITREKDERNQRGYPEMRIENSKVSTRLQGSLFRKINEFLYTSDSEKAFEEYIKDESMFENYHKGYEIQKKSWPVDPLDGIISYISENDNLKVIGDFGCGTARIGQTLGHIKGYKIHSFDLNCSREISEKYNITICNMKDVPLDSGVLDVAVFCLSLMGTDWPLFLKEACRTLKDNGILIITEVSSRIEDPKSFILNLQEQLNLELSEPHVNLTSYFVQFIFRKRPSPTNHLPRSLDKIRRTTFAHLPRRKNVHLLSKLKYKYGLKLFWVYKISKNLESLEHYARPSHPYFPCETNFHLDHKLLKPCMYKKR